MVLHLPLAAISPREFCCNLDAPSGIYHMGDDEALSTSELIEVMCSALGKKAHIWRIPRGLMNGMARVGDWLHLPLNSLRMQKLTENYVVSNAKIKAALGMTEMPVRAKDGLRETIKSFAEKQLAAYGLRFMIMTDTTMIDRLKQFVESEMRSCSMDIGGITPLYVYRMWGGAVAIEDIATAMEEGRCKSNGSRNPLAGQIQ